jgi:hypothetical protein
MTDKRQPGVLGSLPRTRPHRRSDKRPEVTAPAAGPEPEAGAAAPRAPAKPRTATAPKPRAAKPRTATAAKPRAAKPRTATAAKPRAAPPPAPVPGTLETAVQAAAELAEIGLQAGARALRRTLSRLPRP